LLFQAYRDLSNNYVKDQKAQRYQTIYGNLAVKTLASQVFKSLQLLVGFNQKEIIYIHHHSLFAPRDFDISPYFEIIKPTLKQGFNFHDVKLTQG